MERVQHVGCSDVYRAGSGVGLSMSCAEDERDEMLEAQQERREDAVDEKRDRAEEYDSERDSADRES